MKDETFQGIISAIPILIILVFLILPFSSHGWDIGGTILPANPFVRPATGFTGGLLGGGTATQKEPMVSVRSSGLTADGARFYLEVQLRNPLPVEIDVKELSASAPVGGKLVNLALAGPVSIPSGGSAAARLEGPAPKGLNSQGSAHLSLSDLKDLKMTVSSGGVEMTLDENTIRGMLS